MLKRLFGLAGTVTLHVAALGQWALWPMISVDGAGGAWRGSTYYGQEAAHPHKVNRFDILEHLVVAQATADMGGMASLSAHPILGRSVKDCPADGPVDKSATVLLIPVRKATSIWMPKVIERFVPATGDSSHVIFCARISNIGRIVEAYPASGASSSEIGALISTVRQLRFNPALRRGAPVTAWHRVWVDASVLELTPPGPAPDDLA
jgi:hypothetical protein